MTRYERKRRMIDELADALFRTQRDTGHAFTFEEIRSTIVLTTRKAKMNGKGDDYVPVLFENELRDLVMRNRINVFGEMEGKSCARSAIMSHA